MDKKIIWGIIGLMTASVIGIIALQISLINHYYAQNENQFNQNVFEAMAQVSKSLEWAEENEFWNGYSLNKIEENRDEIFIEQVIHGIRELPDGFPLDTLAMKRHIIGVQKRSSALNPIEERISIERLDTLLHKAFRSHGIKTLPQYGVFSLSKEKFVIINNHFAATDNETDIMAVNQLRSTAYRADLFLSDNYPPGQLMVYFPAKAAVVWRNLWQPLLLGFLFAIIILACFAYTVNVIFKQKKVSEMKNDFINNMTHEFKTPISTISLCSDSITSPMVIGNPDKIRRFADIIKQENKRMNSQVEKVLQMALIDREEYKLNISEVNINEVVQQAVSNAALQVEKKEGTAIAIMNATKPTVEGDLTHISNIINNLLDNANKYSPEKPDITVTTKNVSKGVEVSITDKGIGMTREAKKHIFDKFYRAHTGNVHDVKGFGLGLTYVKAMMNAHKGQIEVKSELGKGSTFILFFPNKSEQRD